MQNLRELTWQDEKRGVETVKKELIRLRNHREVSAVSKEADSFVGSAIIKNYKRGGRFEKLREFGEVFQAFFRESLMDDDLYFEEEEVVAARCLGQLLERGVSTEVVFVGAPFLQCALDLVEDNWLAVLEQAVALDDPDNPCTTERIWSCGLTDAGLHNTFVWQVRYGSKVVS